MDIDLAAEDVSHRLHEQVAPWRNGVLVAFATCLVVVPPREVILRINERLADDFLDAHAGLWVLGGDARRWTEVRRFRILTERKFDRAWRIGDRPFGHRMSPLPLHDLRLTA